MTFEEFEVELGQAVRGLENELKAADLARYDVDADAVIVDGKEWRGALAATEDLSECIGSCHGGPEPVSSGRWRQEHLSAGAASWMIGGLYTPVLVTGLVHDGSHDLGRDKHTFHRAGHLRALE